MSKPLIVFDIDGVLADFTGGFTTHLELAPRHQGTQKTWDFAAPQRSVNKVWKAVDASRSFWYNLPSLLTREEVLEVREHVDALGAHALYLTGREDRGNGTLRQTREWLDAFDFPMGKVVINARDKRGIIESMGQRVLGIIDDKPSTVEDLHAHGYPVYVRDWQYNRDLGFDVPRVSTVAEFLSRIEA